MSDGIIKIAVADDHALFRKGLINLILSFDENYKMMIEAENGNDFLKKLDIENLPDILIMDMSMPEMDGFLLTRTIKEKNLPIPILVVSMIDQEASIIRMLKMGVKGYVSKDIDPHDLHNAIKSILNNHYYYADFETGFLIPSSVHPAANWPNTNTATLTDREVEFIRLVSAEHTYQEIANILFLSVKTIDGFRAVLFEKLKVKSRTGLVLYGVKNGLVPLN